MGHIGVTPLSIGVGVLHWSNAIEVQVGKPVAPRITIFGEV